MVRNEAVEISLATAWKGVVTEHPILSGSRDLRENPEALLRLGYASGIVLGSADAIRWLRKNLDEDTVDRLLFKHRMVGSASGKDHLHGQGCG